MQFSSFVYVVETIRVTYLFGNVNGCLTPIIWLSFLCNNTHLLLIPSEFVRPLPYIVLIALLTHETRTKGSFVGTTMSFASCPIQTDVNEVFSIGNS